MEADQRHIVRLLTMCYSLLSACDAGGVSSDFDRSRSVIVCHSHRDHKVWADTSTSGMTQKASPHVAFIALSVL